LRIQRLDAFNVCPWIALCLRRGRQGYPHRLRHIEHKGAAPVVSAEIGGSGWGWKVEVDSAVMI